MNRYAYNPKTENHVKVLGAGLRVSSKNSAAIFKQITGKPLPKAIKFVEGLIEHRLDVDGKYYDNAAKKILELLRLGEHNAEFKGLEAERLFVHASAHKGFSYYRPRRFKMRRQQRKVSNLQIILEQR